MTSILWLKDVIDYCSKEDSIAKLILNRNSMFEVDVIIVAKENITNLQGIIYLTSDIRTIFTKFGITTICVVLTHSCYYKRCDLETTEKNILYTSKQ